MKPHLLRTIGSGIALVFLMGAGPNAAHPNAVASVMLSVPWKGMARAAQVASVPATAMSNSQLSINRTDYRAPLPVSSVVTYVLAPRSSTLVETETTTNGQALKLSQKAPISAGPARPYITWQKMPSLPAGFNVNQLSCTGTWCMAIDDVTRLTLELEGTAWLPTAVIPSDAGFVTSLSCPTPTFCMAVSNRTASAGHDSLGNVLYRADAYTLTWNGKHWHGPALLYSYRGGYTYLRLQAVVCTSTLFCMVTSTPTGSMAWDKSRWTTYEGTTGARTEAGRWHAPMPSSASPALTNSLTNGATGNGNGHVPNPGSTRRPRSPCPGSGAFCPVSPARLLLIASRQRTWQLSTPGTLLPGQQYRATSGVAVTSEDAATGSTVAGRTVQQQNCAVRPSWTPNPL